jgi:cell division protein FtsB
MTSTDSPSLRRGSAAAIVLLLFVAVGIIVVFAGTLTRATEVEEEAARARAELALLEERVAAGRAEIEFVETDRFVEQQARAAGFGSRGETAFRLPDDAPPPPPVVMLGAVTDGTAATSPLEAWMELLFGA